MTYYLKYKICRDNLKSGTSVPAKLSTIKPICPGLEKILFALGVGGGVWPVSQKMPKNVGLAIKELVCLVDFHDYDEPK